MGSTSLDVGSGVGDISILCPVCHCTNDELRGNFPIRFLPHAWIFVVIGKIMVARSNLSVGGIICVIFILPLPWWHGWGRKFPQVDLFISAECDGIDKVRRVYIPVDFIVGRSINTIFMKHKIWKRQDTHLVLIASLVNNSSPLFGHYSHLGFGGINRNCADITWGFSSWHLHPISCGIKNTFDSGIFWNVCSSQHRVGLNSDRGSRDCQSDITEYLLGIIQFLRLGLCLGFGGLQGLAFAIIILPVLVISHLICLSW